MTDRQENITKTQTQPSKPRLVSRSTIYPMVELQLIEGTEEDEDQPLHEQNYYKHQAPYITINDVANEELNRYKSVWHWNQFIEFLIYHILYYIFLGPFTTILLFKFTGINLMYNMRFWGISQVFFAQTLLWLGSASSGLTYLMEMDSLISITEVAFMWFATVIRCVVISAKYATLSPQRIQLYKNYRLQEEHFNVDLMMSEWKLQTPRILFLEPLRAMQRHEFEVSLFKFEFLVQPTQATLTAIDDVEIGYYKEWLDKLGDVPKVDNQFDGFKIFGFLVGQFQKQNPPHRQIIYCYIEAAILALTPLVYAMPTLIEKSPTFFDVLRILLNGNTTMSVLMGSFLFFHIAIYDFQRKFFLTQQCLYMVNTKHLGHSANKLLPTINLNNPRQLQVWSTLRTIILDYGQTYNIRTQGFFSLVFLACITMVFIALSLILQLLMIDTLQMILLGEITLIFFIFNGLYLYCGANANSFFNDYTLAIEDIKSLYLDLQRMREPYFVQNIEPLNLVHKKFVAAIKASMTIDGNIDLVKEYTQYLVSELDDNIRLITYDERNNPFRLYGVKVTYNLLKSALVGLSTVFSYSLQQKFMQK